MRQMATSRSRVRAMLVACGFVFVMQALLLSGCLVPLPEIDLEGFPSADLILECSVTVRNPQAQTEVGVDDAPAQSLSSLGGMFRDNSGQVRRHYYTTVDCIGGDPGGAGYGFSTMADVQADWRLFARQRIREVTNEQTSSSIFSTFPGEWCSVPGTLSCVPTDREIGFCTIRAELANTIPLVDCPPLPSDCLRIACGGEAPCTDINFGQVPTGEKRRREVQLFNCGEAGAPAIEVILDGAVNPIGSTYEFNIPIETNSCHFFAHGDGMVLELTQGDICNFWVEFEPQNTGLHHGETRFITNPGSLSHGIQLRGNALGGALKYSVPDLPDDPTEIPGILCVDDLVDGSCTATRDLVAENAGPGTVTLKANLQDNDGFELVETGEETQFADSGEELTTELAANEAATIRFRWCGAANATGRAELVVTSNTVEPTFSRILSRELASCDGVVVPGPVCGNSIIETGEQCDDGNTVNGDGCNATCQNEVVPLCGNSMIDAGEQCDDGNTTADGNGCLADCSIDTDLVTAYGFEGTNPDPLVRAITGNLASDHDGTLNGATRVANTPLEAGLCGGVDLPRLDQAVSLDGVDDFISIADHDDLDLSSGNYTITAWVRPSGFGESMQGRIIDHGGASGAVPAAVGNTPGAGWTVRIAGPADTGDGSLDLFINQNQLVQVNSDAALGEVTTGQWQHVAVTSENVAGTVTARLYIDGQAVSPATVTEAPLAQATEIRIGNRFNGVVNTERNYNGLIDELRIYNRALDAGEITTMMCSPLIIPATP